MPRRISIDDMLNFLENTNQEELIRRAAKIADTGDWAASFDLAKYIDQLRRLRDAMTPEEQNDPTVIDPRRRAQIASESGWNPEELARFIDSSHRLSRFSDSFSSLTMWRVLGLSQFRPPDRA